jgi:hypothetical protein
MTKKTKRIVIARDVKFDEASLGSRDVKNDFEPVFLEHDDQEDSSTREEDKEEKKEVVDIEEHKISAGTDMGAQPAAGVRKSGRLQVMRGEDKSLDDLSEIETYPDHSCHQQHTGEESSQDYTITSGPSRGSSSKMLPESSSYYTSRTSTVEKWTLGVSQGSEPQSFSDALKSSEQKEWRFAIDSELISLEENKTWEPCVLPEDSNAIPVK